MEAIALISLCDGLPRLAVLCAVVAGMIWLVARSSKYLDAHKPYQGDSNDEY